jgi:hypothetical protein
MPLVFSFALETYRPLRDKRQLSQKDLGFELFSSGPRGLKITQSTLSHPSDLEE